MKANHFHVVLYQPEIPQNTGNIGRLVAATCCRLHLIQPLGFATDDKNLRRAGLDYWPYLDLEIHQSLTEVLPENPNQIAFFSKSAKKTYSEIPSTVTTLVFGQETKGLPRQLYQRYPEQFFAIPMFQPQVRSLNLANSVAILIYDQLKARSLF